MAAPTGTYQTTSAVGNREDLDNVVSRISPSDTPIYTKMEKGTAKATNPTWEYDELAAPAANAQAEGDDYTWGATTPPVKVGNFTQIFRKTGAISGTQEALDRLLRELTTWAETFSFFRTAAKLARIRSRAAEDGIVTFYEL